MRVKINYDNIPQEMKDRPQWCCFDIEGDKKIPYIVGSTKKARVNKDEDFVTFEEAVAEVESGARQHLGYAMRRDDGMGFLDLDHTDDPEEKALNKLIYQTFNSFSEWSVSGKGVHIFFKGNLEGRGLHSSHFGLFDHNRLILVTGHVIDGRDTIYPANKKALRSLQKKVRKSDGRGYDFELEEKEWDAQPCWLDDLALRVYGDKFLHLLAGNWQQFKEYPSQSEADHALINMYCDLSDSNELVRFMFAESGLYREDKRRLDEETGEYSVKGYIDYSIKANRAKVEQRNYVRKEVSKSVAKKVKSAKKAAKKAGNKRGIMVDASEESDSVIIDPDEASTFRYPTGIIDRVPSKLHRDLALYLYKNSYRPNQQFAIAGANVVVTMIAQRAYMTPTKTGCNLNWWLVAETGWGKETFIKAVDKIVGAVVQDLPHLGKNLVGKFASGEAIETVISKQPRFMSKVSEAGAFWRKLLSPNKPPHVDVLVEGMLNLFMATNPDTHWQSRKKAKNDEDVSDQIFRPAGSFFGESTPEDLFGDLDTASISTGLLQRQIFHCVPEAEYVEANQYSEAMSNRLRESIVELVRCADNLDLVNDTVTVKCTARAAKILWEYSEEHNKYAFNKDRDKLRSDFMSRSGLKAYRYASQLAIGNDPHEPVIREDQARYAIKYIDKCDKYMLEKFLSGDIGKGQAKQDSDMMKIIMKFVTAEYKTRRYSYKMTETVAADSTIVPYSWIRSRAKARTSFSQDRRGVLTAIDSCIDSLCKAGVLVRLTRLESETEYDTMMTLLRYTGAD